MAEPGPEMFKNLRIWIEGSDGEMVPVASPRIVKHYIRCLPISGRDGVEYVPDWYGITEHG